MPKRIQRKRTKSWRMPEGAVYVGRPTKWGNPFCHLYSSKLAVIEFRMLLGPVGYAAYPGLTGVRREILDSISELRGKDLACWCPLDSPCHADVLLELANRELG